MVEISNVCPLCSSTLGIETITRNERITVKGETFDVEATFYQCTACRGEFDVLNGPDALESAYSQYRAKHNMVQPEELVKWRFDLGLTQKNVASLLGWSPATVSRYENGALQEEAHDRELRLAMNPAGLNLLLRTRPDCLPSDIQAKLLAWTETELVGPQALEHLISQKLRVENSSVVFTNKLYEMILFFCDGAGQLKTKLNKLLFYTDFKYFKLHQQPLTGLDYLRYDFGPVPRHYDLIYEALKESGLVKIDIQEFGDVFGYRISGARQSNLHTFSERELAVLLDIKERFREISATDISTLSHKEKAWMNTSRNFIISYDHAKELSV